jgi:hypothetical protein
MPNELQNILCIPPYPIDGNVDDAVLVEAAALCRERRAFLILDAPTAWDEISDAVSGVDGIAAAAGTDNARNAAVFFPRLRMNIGGFLQTLFRQGAFQGSSPQEAYFVKCDRSTTSQTDINNGIVNILIGYAPLKPAEFFVENVACTSDVNACSRDRDFPSAGHAAAGAAGDSPHFRNRSLCSRDRHSGGTSGRAAGP